MVVARRDGLVGQGEYFELNSEGNGQPVERVTTGGARCKATCPGDHPGKTVLHFLDLEHVPNCDTMQQGVAVVKPTEHKSRRQALGLVQVQMFSDSAMVADVIVGKFANIVDMSPKIKILIKKNTKISNSFGWVSLTSKDSDRKHGKVF